MTIITAEITVAPDGTMSGRAPDACRPAGTRSRSRSRMHAIRAVAFGIFQCTTVPGTTVSRCAGKTSMATTGSEPGLRRHQGARLC